MQIRESFPGKIYYGIMGRYVLPKLAKHAVTPDRLTLLGLLFALFVPPGFYVHPLCGLLAMLISGLFDSMDGMVARNNGKTSDFGAFLDSTTDRFSDFLYLFGFWVLFWEGGDIILSGVLIFIGLVLTYMVSYIRARAEGLGYHCRSGWMERGIRTVYLLVWALLIGIFPAAAGEVLWWGLAVFCGLTLLTVVQRILAVKSSMS